jgi:NLR family CARD domain-containing protein 3
MADITDYWTNLLRVNLAKALPTTDSDSEEVGLPHIDERILDVPRRKSAKEDLARQIYGQLYPDFEADSLAPIIKYEKDVVMLRAMILQQRRDAVEKATERNAKFDWVKRITKQGPPDVSCLPLTGAPSLPMPVEVSDKVSRTGHCVL